MTGAYEQQLVKIANASDWSIPELDALRSALTSLTNGMAHISGELGWTGGSADAAVQKFLQLRDYFIEIGEIVHTVDQAVDAANAARHHASNQQAQLPSTTVPADVHVEILTASTIAVPFFGPVAAEFAIQKYEEYLRAQREAQAHHALDVLQGALVQPTKDLALSGKPNNPEPQLPEFVEPIPPAPDSGWPGSGVSLGGHSLTGGGGGSWTGGPDGTGVTRPPHTGVPPTTEVETGRPVWTTPTHTSVDGKTTGTTSGFGSGSGGGGLGAGLAGAGIGAGAMAAGSKLAGKTPGSLLGGGGVGVGVGGGLNGAGGKTNAAMMGGGAGAGGGSDKEKRSSLGLVAPKLEDDDEPTARSAAAGAGGRDQIQKE